MEFEGIESSFKLTITGLDRIKKAVDDAAAIIERIPDATFDIRPNVVPIDPAKVFDVNAFKEQLRGVTFDLQKEWARLRAFEFKPTVKSKEFESNVTALFNRVKGVMETAFNRSREIGGAMYENGEFSKIGTVVQLMDKYAAAVASGRMGAEDQTKATKALEQMSSQLLNVFTSMPGTFTAATNSLASFGKEVNALSRTNKGAARELQAGLAAVVTSYGAEVSKALTTLEQNVKMFESSMGGLEQPLIPLGMAARALSGDLTKVMAVDPTNLKKSLQDMQRLLGDLAISTGSFKGLFGPKAVEAAQEYAAVQQRILKLQEQVMGDGASFASKASAALELSRLSTEKALLDQKVAGSMLAARREAEPGLGRLSGFDRLTPYIEAAAVKTAQLKDTFGNYLGMLGVGADVLRNQAGLYSTILNLAKHTGDVEGGVISQELERLDVLARLQEYGARMEATAKTVQDIEGQTNGTMKLRASILQEAANAYQTRAKLATGRAADQAFGDMVRVESQLREQMAGVDFQSAMTDFGASIVRGALPAMNQLVSTVTTYQANSKAAFASGADDVRMLDRVLILLRGRYDALTTSGSKLFTAQRAKTAEAMSYLASVREQATGSSGPVSGADAANTARLAAVEQIRERAAQRIFDEYNKIYALQVAGERVASNQLKLEELFAEAIAKGVPVEQELAKHVRNRGTALASMLNEYRGLLVAAKSDETSAQMKVQYYQAAVDVLKVMQALVSDMGGKTRVANQTLTTEGLAKNIATLQEQARLAEEGPRQTERLNRELRVGLEISRARQQLEEKIVDSIRRAEMEAKGLGKVWEAQNKILQLVMQAAKEGVSLPAGMNALLGHQREAAQEIADIYTRLSDVTTAGLSPTHQLTLVEEKLKTVQRLKEVVGSTPINLTVNGAQVQHTAETLTQIEAKLKTQIEGLNIAMGKIKPQPQPQLVDIAAVGVDQAKVDNTRAEASSRLLGTMKQQKEELLSGVNVLGNWRGLLDNISTALAKNLNIEAAQVNTLLGQEQVYAAIAAAANTIMTKLQAIPNQSVRVAPLAEVARLLDVLATAPGPVKARHNFDALSAAVTKMQAELANVGSPKIAELEARIKALSGALKAAVDDTAAKSMPNSTAFDNVRQGIDRTLGTLKDYKGSIDSLYKSKLFSGQAATGELTGLTTTAAQVQRVIDMMNKLDTLSTKVTADLARFGMTFADITTKSGRNALYNATKDDQSKVYVRIADNIREINTLAGVIPRMINQSQTLSSVFSGWSKPLADMRDQATKADQQLTQMYAKQQHRATAAAGGSIFDVFRMSWFIQLRAFWSMYLGITHTIQGIMNYTHTMNVLRAVTQSTRADLATLERTFDGLAKAVPVSITKLAEGALLVAKAGFSAEETIKVVDSAAKLSYATRADLAKTADLQTVILRSWNMGADQAAKVGDKLFNAVNQSRSDIEGLQAAFGYVSGIAPQANVSLTEMLSVFSVLSNAGLSMDQAGTYTRQFLNDLLNPTDKLVKILTSLGVSLDQVDPRLHSLGDILKLLNSRGMSTAQAFEGMSIRAASAFGVLLSNSDMLEQYSEQITRSGHVNEALKHATKDLSSELVLLQNAFVSGGNSIKNMFGPAIIEASRTVRELIAAFQYAAEAGRGTMLGSIAEALTNGAVKAAILAVGLSGLIKLAKFLNGAFVSLGVSTGMLTRAHWIVAVATAASAASSYMFSSSTRKAEESVDSLRESVEKLQKTGKDGFELKIKIESDRNIFNTVQAAVDKMKNINVDQPGGGNAVRIIAANASSQLMTSPDEELKRYGEQIQKVLAETKDSDNNLLAQRIETIFNNARDAFNKNIRKFADDAGSAKTTVEQALAKLAKTSPNIDNAVAEYKHRHIAPADDKPILTSAGSMPDVYRRHDGAVTSLLADMVMGGKKLVTGWQYEATDIESLMALLNGVKSSIDEAAANVENFNYEGSDEHIARLERYIKELAARGKSLRNTFQWLQDNAPTGVNISQDFTFNKAVKDIDMLNKGVDESSAKIQSIIQKLRADKAFKPTEFGEATGDALHAATSKLNANLVEKTKQQIRSMNEQVAVAKAGAEIARLTPTGADDEQVRAEVKAATEAYKNAFGQLAAANIPVTKLPSDIQKQLSDFVKTLYELNVQFDALSEKRGLAALNGYEAVIKRITQTTADVTGKPLFDEAAVAKLVGLPEAYLKTFRDMTRLDALRSVDRLPQDFADAVHAGKAIYTDKRLAPIQSEASSELAKFIKHINEFRKTSTDLQNKMREVNVTGQHFRRTLADINDVLAGGDLRKLNVYFDDAFEAANNVAPQLKTNLKELRDALLKTTEIGGAMGSNVESALADYKHAGDAATTAWTGVKDSLVATTKALNDLGSKSRQISLDMNRSDYEYAKTRRGLSTERQSPENDFFNHQENIRLQGEFIRENAKLMSVEDLISGMKEYQSALIEFAKQYPDQPRARDAVTTADQVQETIRLLYGRQREQVELEKQIQLEVFTNLTAVLAALEPTMHTLASAIDRFTAKLDAVPSAQLSRGPLSKLEPYQTRVGAKDTPAFTPDVEDAIATAAAKHGWDQEFMRRIAYLESGGRPGIANGTSSAKGLFQFTKSTGAKYGMNQETDFFNPAMNADAAGKELLHIQEVLSRAGVPVNSTSLYLGLQLGPQGAVDLMKAAMGQGGMTPALMTGMNANYRKSNPVTAQDNPMETAKAYYQLTAEKLGALDSLDVRATTVVVSGPPATEERQGTGPRSHGDDVAAGLYDNPEGINRSDIGEMTTSLNIEARIKELNALTDKLRDTRAARQDLDDKLAEQFPSMGASRSVEELGTTGRAMEDFGRSMGSVNQQVNSSLVSMFDTMVSGAATAAAQMARSFIEGSGDIEQTMYNLEMTIIQIYMEMMIRIMMIKLMASLGGMGGDLGGVTPAGPAPSTAGGNIGPAMAYTRAHTGGLIGYAGGGLVTDGVQHRDSMLAALTKGEMVIQEPVVRALGVDFFQDLNSGRTRAAIGRLNGAVNVGSSVTAPDGVVSSGQNQYPAAGQSDGRNVTKVNVTNIVDPAALSRFVSSDRGRRTILNVVSEHPYIKRER